MVIVFIIVILLCNTPKEPILYKVVMGKNTHTHTGERL